jgi:NAD+ synthase
VASLCVRALGPKRVFGLFTPERDSDPESLRLGRLLAAHLGIDSCVEDIAPILATAGCYRRRDDFIREVFPDYGPGYKSKMVLPGVLENKGYNVNSLVVQAPDGSQRRARLPLHVFLGIVAATNMKQRTRKQIEYYHADRLNFAVAGTPNRLEYDQGFFVKNGDGAADIKPIAHLYKTQVYRLAEYLGVPEEIRRRPPTTDTYSLPQTQEEFFFSIPLEKLDLCLWALNNQVPSAEAAAVVGLTPEQVEHVYRDIAGKRHAGRYQHEAPLLVEPV